VNILSTFADQTSDEALYYDAQKDVDNRDYNSALTRIADMSDAYAASAPVLRLKASAYGGLCGYDFLNFVQQLSAMGSTRLFPFLLASFDASVAGNIDYCKQAHDTLISIGSISERSPSDNFMIAMFGFAKIGNILSYYGDKTHAGSATAGFDPCTAGTDRTTPGNQISDDDAREIGTGMTLALANLTAVSGSISAGSAQLSSITAVCSSLPPGYDFCAVTDPTAFTAQEVSGIRTLLNEDSSVGLGSNCTGDPTACLCP
jgi:hypothetical protein